MKNLTNNSRDKNSVSMLHLFEVRLDYIIFDIPSTLTTNTEVITYIYQTGLGREPDAGGLQFWEDYWEERANLSKQDIRRLMMGEAIISPNETINGETIYITDHDIFVNYNGNEYIPMNITFDKAREDIDLQANVVNISVENLSSYISNKISGFEWRNNQVKLDRVIYTPQSYTLDDTTYQYGIGDSLQGSDVYPTLNLTNTNIDKDIIPLFYGIITQYSFTQQSMSITLANEFQNWNKPLLPRTFNQSEFNSIISTMLDTVYWGRYKDV